MNWLDVVLAVVLAGSVAGGLAGGFARVAIGFATTVLAFLLAAWFYPIGAEFVSVWVSRGTAANVLGFVLIFAAVSLAGALVARLVRRLFRGVGLTWLDRLLGGAFGFVRGVAVGVVIVMLLVSASPLVASEAVVRSELAPLFMRTAKVLVRAVPPEVSGGFERGYDKVQEAWRRTVGREEREPRREQY